MFQYKTNTCFKSKHLLHLPNKSQQTEALLRGSFKYLDFQTIDEFWKQYRAKNDLNKDVA